MHTQLHVLTKIGQNYPFHRAAVTTSYINCDICMEKPPISSFELSSSQWYKLLLCPIVKGEEKARVFMLVSYRHVCYAFFFFFFFCYVDNHARTQQQLALSRVSFASIKVVAFLDLVDKILQWELKADLSVKISQEMLGNTAYLSSSGDAHCSSCIQKCILAL